MSQSDNGFIKVMRGYDPDAVDKTIQELNRDLVLTKNELSDLSHDLRETKRELGRALSDLEQRGAPSYAGLGEKLEHTLRSAEEASTRLLSDAEHTASGLLSQATEEAVTIRSSAEAHYSSKMAEADEQVQHLLSEARVRADLLLQEAEARAEETRSEALREAAAIRGAVATEAAELRTTSKREAEALKSHAALEAAEIKTVALNEATESLSPDALLNQQIRQDLEVELAARRFKAEQEYLNKHQEAVLATRQYLDQANALLAEIIRRLNDKRLEVDTIEASAESEAKKLLETTRLNVEEKTSVAEQTALETVMNAERQAKKLIRDAQKELASAREEEKALRQYFAGMKSLINQAAKQPRVSSKPGNRKKPKAIEPEIHDS